MSSRQKIKVVSTRMSGCYKVGMGVGNLLTRHFRQFYGAVELQGVNIFKSYFVMVCIAFSIAFNKTAIVEFESYLSFRGGALLK